jgi:hypothetical protein
MTSFTKKPAERYLILFSSEKRKRSAAVAPETSEKKIQENDRG